MELRGVEPLSEKAVPKAATSVASYFLFHPEFNPKRGISRTIRLIISPTGQPEKPVEYPLLLRLDPALAEKPGDGLLN